MTTATAESALDPQTAAFYVRALRALAGAHVPFLVGGAYAFGHYTGIARHTKDFDIFVRPRDRDAALAALAALGCRTEVTFPHWLAKGHLGGDFIDVIFGAGNGVARVDDDWFTHASEGEVLGERVGICAAEEIIWSKAFIMERERYDGADVAHLIRARGRQLDWDRLLARFDSHWRVLLAHLTMFGFIYPCERVTVPPRIMRALIGRLEAELDRPGDEPFCRGTLVSRAQYLTDVQRWGYTDARLAPHGWMSADDVALWTAAIDLDE